MIALKRLFSSKAIRRPFYVTTPIFYVNSVPHIGHLYTTVIADAIQRFERLVDPSCQVVFSTGTDEHGLKVQRAASKHGLPIQAYCDEISDEYRTLFRASNVTFTDFIRTSEERHTQAVQHFWNDLKEKGYIYSCDYSGWYCVNDETFTTESHLKDEIINGVKVKVSIESGHPVEWTEEKNYMFRLSAFKSDLREWLKQDGVIQPSKFQHILRNMISANEFLPDVSISRPISRVHWAISVPDDPSQGIYVWLDALINYLTVVGYPDEKKMKCRGNCWPVDIHVVGQDILKFHGLYWPAFLMAVGLHPPRSILCHSHWTIDGRKMSKSLHNVVNPYNTLGGLEALRYFLLREGTMASNANYSQTKLIRILNAELAGTLGNLLNRCTGINLNPRQEYPQLHIKDFNEIKNTAAANKLISKTESMPGLCYDHYINFNFHKVVDCVIATLHAANEFFEATQPWMLKKSPEKQKELDVVLHMTMEVLRLCGIILLPIIPEISKRLLDKLQIAEKHRNWEDLQTISWQSTIISKPRHISTEKVTLFQRIDLDKDKKAGVLT